MSQPDPMPAAAANAARTAATLAALAAAIAKMLIAILRESQRRETTNTARAGRQNEPNQRAAAAAKTSPDRATDTGARTSVHDQVFAGLPEQMARAVTTSPQFGDFATMLRDAERQGINVPALLSALAPALARQQDRTTATSSTGQAPAPTEADRPGLRDRIKGALARHRNTETLATAAAWMSPDDQAWAVATAIYACGVDGADRLVTSQHWPQIAQDLVTLGYGQQYGFTDVPGAQVLEMAWRAMPSSAGIDWPTAATVSLSQACAQFARGQAPEVATEPARGQEPPRQSQAPDTQPVPIAAAAEEPQSQSAPAPDPAPRALDAATATSCQMDPTPSFSDGLTAVPDRVNAALARPSGVAQDAVLHVVDHPSAQQQASDALSRARRQGR